MTTRDHAHLPVSLKRVHRAALKFGAGRPSAADNDRELLDRCTNESLRLLYENLTPCGILAASRSEAADPRAYTRIFGRDAAICVMAMCGSGVPALEQGAVASLDALGGEQAANGQIPKYVDPEGQMPTSGTWAASMPPCGG